jgi:cleavage stimulation factor subunit 3
MSDSDLQQGFEGEAYDPMQTAAYDDADLVDEEDDDDYDPSNMQFQDARPSEQPATDGSADSSSTQPSAPVKQRTVGGFIEDDDDDEEDTPTVNMTGQDIAAAMSVAGQQQRSVTQTPVNNATPDISIEQAATTAAAAQDQGSSGVTVPSININNSAPPSTNGVGAAIGLTPSQSPLPPNPVVVAVASSSSTVPLPKARLPQDRVGILEDRIAADPRGDTDAWLSLIEEYKQRNKIEEVYETYERFLKIFPQAVGYFNSELVDIC